MIGLFWYFLGLVCGIFLSIIAALLAEEHPICGNACRLVVLTIVVVSVWVFNSCTYVYARHLPRQPSGRYAKLAAYLITLFAALLLRLYTEYSLARLGFLVFFLLEVLVVWKLVHGATDISFYDAMMGTMVQIAAYLTMTGPYFIAVLVLSGAIIFCRFWFYPIPETCLNVKQDLEMSHSLVEPPRPPKKL